MYIIHGLRYSSSQFAVQHLYYYILSLRIHRFTNYALRIALILILHLGLLLLLILLLRSLIIISAAAGGLLYYTGSINYYFYYVPTVNGLLFIFVL